MGLKRIIRRTYEELSATVKISKITSFREALVTFFAKIDIQVLSKNGYKETKRQANRLKCKHQIMMKYFRETFKDYLEEYKADYFTSLDEDKSDTIWICWWQGIENAPDIVKICVNSIKKHCGNKKIIIIDNSNYRKYVEIPQWVEEKKVKGIISSTHFSDILRLFLLSTYGGLWLDATFFCVKNIEHIFEYDLWSIKRPDYLHCSIASGYFATYALRCNFEKRWIFKTILDLYLHYWSVNDKQIDYLTLDYMFVLAQEIDSNIRYEFQLICNNNPRCDDLFKFMPEIFDNNNWKMLCEDTNLFKLSWKHTFPHKKKRKDTFYSKLIKGELY